MTQGVTAALRHILDELDRCRSHIEAALAHAGGTHTFDDVCLMVVQGRVRFWPLANGCFLTEVLDYPQQKHYHVWLGGGDLEEILAMHPQVEQAAREAKCTHLSVVGRLGWKAALKSYGWEARHVTCIKPLGELSE